MIQQALDKVEGGVVRASVIHNFSLNLEIPPRFFFLPSFLLFFFLLYMSTHYSRDPPSQQIISFNSPQPLNHFLFNWSDSRTLLLSKNRVFFSHYYYDFFLFFPENRKNQFPMGIYKKKNYYNNKKKWQQQWRIDVADADDDADVLIPADFFLFLSFLYYPQIIFYVLHFKCKLIRILSLSIR